MDVEEIQRVASTPREPNKIGQKSSFCDENEGELKMVASGENISVGGGGMNNEYPLRGWHHSSRIFRVSRASGGKDRHSKVWTAKGLRDRRVRLSVTTAIQFYDLQDRLGYDQPSKAVEWLIKAAADAISELPPFPETPRQASDEKRNSTTADTAEMELDGGDVNFQQQHQNPHLSLSKSSKGSGLSLSRCEIRESRVKRRERARERTAKERDQNVNPISQTVNSSFTELLAGGGLSSSDSSQAAKPWSPTPMDYFGMGLLAPSSSSSSRSHLSSGFPLQIQLGNSLSQSVSIPAFNVPGENNHPELQHLPLVSDHIIPLATSNGDYNLNFTISPALAAGFINNNRGTLQSNSSPSILHHFQKFSPLDGSNAPFFIGTTAASSSAAAAAQSVENHHHHHQFSSGFDGRLQLYYADGSAHSDQKGKGKNRDLGRTHN